jgi:hypothetical protein
VKIYCSEDYISSKTIFVFWTGDNSMSVQRKECFNKLVNKSGCKVILITRGNLNNWILPEAPLHPAFEYLSFTHKADYLRTYFMHFYGGGYSDIKAPSNNWIKGFMDMENHPSCLINGYHEAAPSDVAFVPHQKYWKLLPGNCAYIVRPNTDFTQIWYHEMIKTLDAKLNDLEKSPAKEPQDCREKGQGYPIEWNEILGRIFHKHVLEYNKHVLFTVPRPIFEHYR